MASNPKPGDVVMSMDDNGVVTIAIIYAVGVTTVDAMRVNTFGVPSQGTGFQAAVGLTEVPDIASLRPGVPEHFGVPTVAGTWCRREVCG